MPPDPERSLLEHVLLPVATAADAAASAHALEPYRPRRVTALHVVEKAGGAPDKLSPEQAETVAADAMAEVRAVFPDAGERTAYGEAVAETVFDVAAEVDATAIAFRPRGGSRLTQFLAGDHALQLVTQADRPVIALPDPPEE